MTREDKDLLLKDLCARLPHNIKVQYEGNVFNIDYISSIYGEIHLDIVDKYTIDVSEVKPYLFPLSSMTKEQFLELTDLCNMYDDYNDYDPHEYWGIQVCRKHIHRNNLCFSNNYEVIDWLNKNHFDYRGLIDKGLVIDCTNLNIY